MAAGLVEGFKADEVGRDVAAHVEALHFGGGGREAPLTCPTQWDSGHERESKDFYLSFW